MRIQPPPGTTLWLGQDGKGKWWCGQLVKDGDRVLILANADKQMHEVERGSLKTL